MNEYDGVSSIDLAFDCGPCGTHIEMENVQPATLELMIQVLANSHNHTAQEMALFFDAEQESARIYRGGISDE